ncbi:CsbD family protein [Chromobacterium sphagni]|uniref:CsbD family protein n=1 Tax=Chromobacterium sphagni TaxID=1903179 RepID=UPI0019D32B25|nr:hypothetical protein [Chromobacterium sphagni]
MSGITERFEAGHSHHGADRNEKGIQDLGMLVYQWFWYVNLFVPSLILNMWRQNAQETASKLEAIEQAAAGADGKSAGYSAVGEVEDHASNLNWKQRIGTAKQTWSRLTEDELLQTEGDSHKLAALLKERYSLSGEVADKQAMGFLDHSAA